MSSMPASAAESTAVPGEQARDRWLAPGLLLASLLGVGLIFWPSTQTLLQEWIDTPSSTYAQGPLVVVLAWWLAVRAIRRDAVPIAAEARPQLSWLALLALSFLWLVALRAGVQVAHQSLLPVFVFFCVRAAMGRAAAMAALAPLGMLFFAIPLWHLFLPHLQAITVVMVGFLLRVADIPAHVEGDLVHIPNAVFHIEDGCAGLHYFIIGASIAALSGELRGDRLTSRLLLLLFAVSLAMIGNWLRIFIIVLAGYLTDMRHYLVTVDHGDFGWAVFAVTVGMFVLVVRMKWPEPQARQSQTALLTAGGRTELRATGVALSLALCVSASGPVWNSLSPITAAARPNLAMPVGVAGWSGPSSSCQTNWQPVHPDADWRDQREFSREGRAVCVYLASYLSQHQSKEITGYWTAMYAPESRVVSAATIAAGSRTVNEVRLESTGGADRLVWYAYVIGGSEVRGSLAAQLRYAFGSLFGAPASSVYAISATCEPDCAAARKLLSDFLPHGVPVGEGDRR